MQVTSTVFLASLRKESRFPGKNEALDCGLLVYELSLAVDPLTSGSSDSLCATGTRLTTRSVVGGVVIGVMP